MLPQKWQFFFTKQRKFGTDLSRARTKFTQALLARLYVFPISISAYRQTCRSCITKSPGTVDRWLVTHDAWHVTQDTRHMIYFIFFIYIGAPIRTHREIHYLFFLQNLFHLVLFLHSPLNFKQEAKQSYVHKDIH